jgi:mannose-6-phosphate isomerase
MYITPLLKFSMKINRKIYKLEGKVQNYAWGGFHFIPNLLGIDNSAHKPFAEYWMGVHPLAPSELLIDEKRVPLSEIINENREYALGKQVADAFDSLPFLFKILDVHDMLSIQVHPSKPAAVKGFEEEEKKGIPASAPHRNYKDKNDKPEMALALSEFWLLHGFLPEEKILTVLDTNIAFAGLKNIFLDKRYKGLYEYIMTMPQHEVDERLLPLINDELQKKSLHQMSKHEPGWWVCKLFNDRQPTGNIDRGVFSIYILNIVQMQPGQAIFQGAGLLHAYLEGQNLELMTNSDNVLRGGLTPKHIDVPELLMHTVFEPTEPALINEIKISNAEINYPVPADSFAFSKVVPDAAQSQNLQSTSPEIWLVTKGQVSFKGTNIIKAATGECVCVLANEKFSIKADEESILYRAFVPV